MPNIPLYGSTGDLFNRLGKIGALIKNARSYQGTQLTAMTDTASGVVAQFDSESDIQAEMGSNYQSLLNTAGGSIGSFCQQMAIDTLNRMVFRANRIINQNLTQVNLEGSLIELIRQMELQNATVLAMTVSATPGSFTGTGNGVINASVKRPFDGRFLENVFAENLLFICTGDSYNGTAIAGNEPFSVQGTGASDSPWNFDWPLGSNAQTSINAIDGNSDFSAGNILTNSGYESWTNNIPDNWDLDVGVAGTNTNRNNSIVYDGEYSLQITGDGSGTLTSLLQEFDSESGTLGTIGPQQQVSYCVWTRRDGTAPAAGS